MTRLQSLRNRRKILIKSNAVNNFTQTANPRIEKYYSVMLKIRKEINYIECLNVHPRGVLNGKTVNLFR